MNARLILSLVVFVLWLIITLGGGNMVGDGETTLLDGVKSGVSWPILLAAAFALLVVFWRGWGREVGLKAPESGRSVLLAWLPMIYIVAGFGVATFLGLPPATIMLWIALNTFLVGLSEELIFRGILLQGFRNTLSIWPAVLVTSVLFGAVHSLNVFVTGELFTSVVQSVAAFLSGLFFIALRLRTGSLWPPIIVHALWDFATFVLAAASAGVAGPEGANNAPTLFQALAPVLLVTPNALYGLWLMRNIGKTHTNPMT